MRHWLSFAASEVAAALPLRGSALPAPKMLFPWAGHDDGKRRALATIPLIIAALPGAYEL